MGNAPSGSQDEGDEHNGRHVYEDDDEYAAQFDGIDTLGYRVLGVQPNSPASEAGLVSFLDFIVGANEQMLLGSSQGLQVGEEYDDVDFPALLQDAASKKESVQLLVWNLKAQDQRIVTLRPRNDWGGAGLLGVTIRLDNYGGAEERLVRILEVEKHSPASDCGLQSDGSDYLLGTTAVALETTDVLASVLHQHVDRIVELYVYNSETDLVRVVGLMPTYKWSNGRVGGGLLGAEVGTGYLHRLPEKCRATTGKSVERTVQVLVNNNNNDEATTSSTTDLNDTNVQMEPHLEMEVVDDEHNDDDRTSPNNDNNDAHGHQHQHDVVDDEDIMRSGATASPRTKQPHQLGIPTPPKPPKSRTNNQQQLPPDQPERQESLRSVSISSETVGTEYQQVQDAAAAAVVMVDDAQAMEMASSTIEPTTTNTSTESTPQPPPPPPQPQVERHDDDDDDNSSNNKTTSAGDQPIGSETSAHATDSDDKSNSNSADIISSQPPQAPQGDQNNDDDDDDDDAEFPQAAPVLDAPTRKDTGENEEMETESHHSNTIEDKEEEEPSHHDDHDHEDEHSDSDEYETDDEYTDDEEEYETDDEDDEDAESPDQQGKKKKKGLFW